ncbi:hypothetical protein BDY24DRAFT_98197 [Mrakia frigida]|uniref:DUF4210 domain-containing protein n=1 Tax=Mrakia frigida TaxID=29902 RepID=UPI003FCC0FCE
MLNPGVGFAGSYEASLLSFRFSTTPSPPLPFRLSLGVLGIGPSAPPSLRCPAHLSLPISAHFFPLTSPPPSLQPQNLSSPSSSPNLSSTSPSPSSLAPQQTPYLSSFDLTSHYLLNPPPFPALLPAFPGYQLPPKGQLQLVISNPTGTGVKVFLVPYDCEGMGEGERMVLRLKEYENDETQEGKEVLRGSVVVHICSPPNHHSATGGGSKSSKSNDYVASSPTSLSPSSPPPPPPPPQQRYYLHSTLRLVFSPLSPSRSTTTSSSSSSSQSKPTSRTLIDLGSPSLGSSRFLPFELDPDLVASFAARKARRYHVKHDHHPPSLPTPSSTPPAEEERGRRVDDDGSRRRERGEGGGEGVVLSFGKRRQVVGRRKGEGSGLGGGEEGGRERGMGEEEAEGERKKTVPVESELSRRMKGMGLVGR